MKIFTVIVGGFFSGNILCFNLNKDVTPKEAGIYLSFFDNLLFSTVISFFSALVFWGFLKLFRVQAKNHTVLFLFCFAVQVTTWGVLYIFPLDFGMLGFLVATLVFSVLANYFLDRI